MVDDLNLVGATLGNYRVLAEIGRGGMAIVYRAHQPSLNRDVAIKVLPPQFTFDQLFLQRFLREAQAAASLRHPHVVVVHDVAEQNGLYYIVMEYLPGRTLQRLIQEEGPIPPARVARIIEGVASALDYAHRRGFVHRDVKPSNIFLGEDDHATLTDFGIAKAASGTQLTRSGVLIGTPEYMSPEQARGEEIGPATDIYALGIVVYQMLTGQVPFGGTTPHAVLYKHIYESPPPLSALQPGLPPVLEQRLGRALAKDPRARYPSAGAFAEELVNTLGLPGPTRSPALQARAASPAATKPVRPRPAPSAESRPRAPAWLWVVGLLLVAALILIVGLAILLASSPVDTEATAQVLAGMWATQTAEAMPGPTQFQPTVPEVVTSDLGPLPDTKTPTPTATWSPTPTGTTTRTATPTSSRTPTLTATATRTTPKPPTGFFLDSFEGYSNDADLRSTYTINAAWGQNVGQLSLASSPNVSAGERSAAFYYEIRNPAPEDYAGFERSFPAQNWQPYSALCVWVKSDGSARDLLIQFQEVSGEVWRYRINLSTFPSRELRLPLNEETFQHADWSTYQNGRIDLGAIEYYGVYVGDGGQGAGTIYVDAIRLE